MYNRTADSRPIPRLMSPRLPLGRRWLRFCRSRFVRKLRTSVCDTATVLVVVTAAVTFYLGVNVMAAIYVALGGHL